MKKISLKNLNLNEVEQLSREQLKNVVGGFVDGSGEGNCGENAYYDSFLSTCVCNSGYYFSYPYNKCVEGSGSGGSDSYPKISACSGKQEFDSCSWMYQGTVYSGTCRYRMASELYCSDTIFT